MKAGVWEKIPGFALREATLGVIGVGNVGKAVIRRANGFGMRIRGNDRGSIEESYLSQAGISMVSLDQLLAESDFVSVNCDLNPTCFHLLSTAQFVRMKKNAVIINTARGPILDEKALVEALAQKQIAGAGLDVFEDEPLPANSPLRTMNNVLLAPHNANSSPEAWENVHRTTLNNLFQKLGLPPLEQEELA